MQDKVKSRSLSDWGMYVIGCGLIFTIGILAYQFYQWLKIGEWVKLPLYKALQYFGIGFEPLLDIEWQGLQKFIFWILEQPLAGVVGVSSLVIGWLMTIKD